MGQSDFIQAIKNLELIKRDTETYRQSYLTNEDVLAELDKFSAKELEQFSNNLNWISEMAKEVKQKFYYIEYHGFAEFAKSGHNKVLVIDIRKREVYDNGVEKRITNSNRVDNFIYKYNKTNKDYHKAIIKGIKGILRKHELVNKEDLLDSIEKLTSLRGEL